jgi:hypothetical protein
MLETQTGSCGLKAAKWVAVVDDRVIPMPRQNVDETLIKEQASLGPELSLVRDHNSPDDEVIEIGAPIDLATGNVFYSEQACDVEGRKGQKCSSPAKLAFTVDDRAETVIRADQTSETIRTLFGVAEDRELIRDYESPNDEVLVPEAQVRFSEGPVLITRPGKHVLRITVNRKSFGRKEGVKEEMTGREIASLVNDNPNRTDVFKITGGRRQVGLDEKIEIHNCDDFEVIRRDVSGGYAAERVKQDIAKFEEGGGKITLLPDIPAVIYRDVPAHGGADVADVLVRIPANFPAQMLDGAHLVAGSPYLHTALGQNNQGQITADGVNWVLKSYHPHNGGGGPPWDPNKHGIHTYYDELLNWLIKA